jgi:hypothetical protein
VSSHRATVLRRGSWDYGFLSSRGVRRQYSSLIRKLKGIYRGYMCRSGVDYSRANVRLYTNKRNWIEKLFDFLLSDSYSDPETDFIY